MYRYSGNREITYTPEDFILFRESPFASWMERLSLENPHHGIAPDSQSADLSGVAAAAGQALAWEEFVSGIAVKPEPAAQTHSNFESQLLARGKSVVSVATYAREEECRSVTLEAMRAGAEYIVDAQLALGPLALSIDLLIRFQGASELGGHFYLPGAVDGSHAIHHLCFAADLLQGLQGVLPSHLLLMRREADMVNLPTLDHIERFRDLKYEFMTAQLAFRKHRMPDPAQSSHFGRWSNFAHSVIARRAAPGVLDNEAQAPSSQVLQHSAVLRSEQDGIAQSPARQTAAGGAGPGLVAAMDQAVARSALEPLQARPVEAAVPCVSDYSTLSLKEGAEQRRCG